MPSKLPEQDAPPTPTDRPNADAEPAGLRESQQRCVVARPCPYDAAIVPEAPLKPTDAVRRFQKALDRLGEGSEEEPLQLLRGCRP